MEHGLSVLCQAARDGSVEIVEELLKKGARVNEKVQNLACFTFIINNYYLLFQLSVYVIFSNFCISQFHNRAVNVHAVCLAGHTSCKYCGLFV